MITIKPGDCAQLIEPDRFGHVQLSTIPELPGPGWCVIAILWEEEIEKEAGDAVVYEPPYAQGGTTFSGQFQTVHNVTHPFKVMKPLFLMGRLKEPAFEDAQEKVSEANQRINELMSQVEAARRDGKRAAEERDQVKKERDELATGQEEALMERGKAQGALVVAREQLSVLKDEIGAARWREIFGDEEKKQDA